VQAKLSAQRSVFAQRLLRELAHGVAYRQRSLFAAAVCPAVMEAFSAHYFQVLVEARRERIIRVLHACVCVLCVCARVRVYVCAWVPAKGPISLAAGCCAGPGNLGRSSL
jgi:hypothetical protein